MHDVRGDGHLIVRVCPCRERGQPGPGHLPHVDEDGYHFAFKVSRILQRTIQIENFRRRWISSDYPNSKLIRNRSRAKDSAMCAVPCSLPILNILMHNAWPGSPKNNWKDRTAPSMRLPVHSGQQWTQPRMDHAMLWVALKQSYQSTSFASWHKRVAFCFVFRITHQDGDRWAS